MRVHGNIQGVEDLIVESYRSNRSLEALTASLAARYGDKALERTVSAFISFLIAMEENQGGRIMEPYTAEELAAKLARL